MQLKEKLKLLDKDSISEILSMLSSAGIHITLNTKYVKELFANEGLFIRSIIKSSQEISSTKGKKERDILTDRYRENKIIIVPVTFIKKGFHVMSWGNELSLWNIPSAIYSISNNLNDKLLDNNCFYGYKEDIGSDHGINTYLNKINHETEKYSHAQLMEGLKDTLKTRPDKPHLVSSIPKLIKQLSKDQNRILPHNEVNTHLTLLNLISIPIDTSSEERIVTGLALALELQIGRKTLAKELRQLRTEHPFFKEFLLRQLSTNKGNTNFLSKVKPGLKTSIALTKQETLDHYNKLSIEKKESFLEKIISKLEEEISICHYSAKDSKVLEINNAITGKHMLTALDAVLKARLNPSPVIPQN